jgi:hypothetical protein
MSKDDDDLIADIMESGGKVAQWIEREKAVYLAHAGREGTLEGFREHIAKMIKADPGMSEMFVLEYVDALIAAEPWEFDE